MADDGFKNGQPPDFMRRLEIQESLTKAKTASENPAALLCIEPFASIDEDGGERLGRLLALVIREPNRAFITATSNAFVFTLDDQITRNVSNPDGETSSDIAAAQMNIETKNGKTP
jgi:ABC-type lipoprotein export system ATPase subunit